MTVTIDLLVDDQTVALTIADPAGPGATPAEPAGVTATPADPTVWNVTTALQVPQPPPWQAPGTGTGDGTATADTTITASGTATGTGEGRAVLPATWADFHTAYPTWADRNGRTWSQLTTLETGA